MRGRSIFKFVSVLAQLDTQLTAVDPLLREPTTTIDLAGVRTKGRKERIVQCRCQVETGTFEQQGMTPMGNAPASSLTLVFHYDDLGDAELIGPLNRPLINVNDRLVRIEDLDGEVMVDYARAPVYVTEAAPAGVGFGGRVNLLVVRLGDRPQAVRQGGG